MDAHEAALKHRTVTLLPLTIGVLGDWGSGKSSLMRIAAQELAALRPQGETIRLRIVTGGTPSLRHRT